MYVVSDYVTKVAQCSAIGSGIVGVATSYGVGGPGFESRPEQKIFSSAIPSGSALGPTISPVNLLAPELFF